MLNHVKDVLLNSSEFSLLLGFDVANEGEVGPHVMVLLDMSKVPVGVSAAFIQFLPIDAADKALMLFILLARKQLVLERGEGVDDNARHHREENVENEDDKEVVE